MNEINIKWMNEWIKLKFNKWINQWINESVNKWINE